MRAPRLLGAPAAMDLMLTGRALSASSAKAMGLVDRVVDQAVLLDEAVKLVERGTVRPAKQRFLAWITNTGLGRAMLAPQITSATARKARKEHYPAPFALIDTWRHSGGFSSAFPRR